MQPKNLAPGEHCEQSGDPGFFQICPVFIENLNTILAACHISIRLPDPSTLMPFGAAYILPVGISFFTFQSLSYTIDFYRGLIHRERNFLRFATFVAFFPQLMAGPIERAAHLLPQFFSPPRFGHRILPMVYRCSLSAFSRNSRSPTTYPSTSNGFMIIRNYLRPRSWSRQPSHSHGKSFSISVDIPIWPAASQRSWALSSC